MSVTTDTDRYARRWLQWSYFRMGMFWAEYVPPDRITGYLPPAPKHRLVDRVLGTCHLLQGSDRKVRTLTLQPAPAAFPGDLSRYSDSAYGLEDWHRMGTRLMDWLTASQMTIDLCLLRHGREDVLGGRVPEIDPYPLITLPPLNTFLDAVATVAALELDPKAGPPTIRLLGKAVVALQTGRGTEDIWRSVGLTYREPDPGNLPNVYRTEAMFHVGEALYRDMLHLSVGHTPSPYWDRKAGKLYLHHRELLKLDPARCDGTLTLLNGMEDSGWLPAVTFDSSTETQRLRQHASWLNHKMEGRPGVYFRVSQRVKAGGDLTVTWELTH